MSLDDNLHRRRRPGYGSIRERVPEEDVDQWIENSREDGIERVVVLLSEKELTTYYDDLLRRYREEFGGDNVLHAPVEDYSACSHEQLHDEVLPFLRESVKNDADVAVHCSAGVGRTGQVLFAWLVDEQGMSVEDAISEVKEVGCNPLEALSEEELHELVR